jgi:hypothetical protein
MRTVLLIFGSAAGGICALLAVQWLRNVHRVTRRPDRAMRTLDLRLRRIEARLRLADVYDEAHPPEPDPPPSNGRPANVRRIREPIAGVSFIGGLGILFAWAKRHAALPAVGGLLAAGVAAAVVMAMPSTPTPMPPQPAPQPTSPGPTTLWRPHQTPPPVVRSPSHAAPSLKHAAAPAHLVMAVPVGHQPPAAGTPSDPVQPTHQPQPIQPPPATGAPPTSSPPTQTSPPPGNGLPCLRLLIIRVCL